MGSGPMGTVQKDKDGGFIFLGGACIKQVLENAQLISVRGQIPHREPLERDLSSSLFMLPREIATRAEDNIIVH